MLSFKGWQRDRVDARGTVAWLPADEPKRNREHFMPPDNDRKRKAILDRIESLQDAIDKAREYLESGRHAHWSGFRPLLVRKERDGKELPPSKDWVRNVFLPRNEKALARAEKLLERFS